MKNQKLHIGILFSLIIICVAMFMQNAPHIWDIQLWDETLYMATGIFNWDNNFRFYEVSPLYSYIYKTAWIFMGDPATLHLWMGVSVVAAAIISTAVAVFIVSRSTALSAITVAVMIASGYSGALPKLVYAAISIISIGFAVSTLAPRLHTKMAIIALTAFTATFIRPEFVISFYAATTFSFIAALASIKSFQKDRLWFGLTIAVLSFIALLSKLWIFPVLSGGARALMAFGQHYSLYLLDTGKINTDPFLNYEKILAQFLPGATSEVDALQKYPGEIIAYFLFNVASAFKASFSAVLEATTNHPILIIAIVALLIYCVSKRKRGNFNIGNAASWLILCAPTAMSIVLIFAREHYLVVAVTLIMLLAALVFRWMGPRDTIVGAAGILVLATIIVKPIPPTDQLNLQTALSLKVQKPFGSLLELDGGWCYYAQTTCRPVFALDVKTTNLVRYLDEAHINGVMASPTFLEWAKDNNQPELVKFINDGAYGWTKTTLSKDHVLIRRDDLGMTDWGTVLTSNAMKYVSVNHTGKLYGVVSKLSNTIVYAHPGASDPTSFSIDLGRLAKDASCSGAKVTAKIDERVPPEAIARGGAVIGVAFDGGKNDEQRGIVSSEHAMTLSYQAAPPVLKVIIDDHGNPDTDWLNIDIQPIGCGG